MSYFFYIALVSAVLLGIVALLHLATAIAFIRNKPFGTIHTNIDKVVDPSAPNTKRPRLAIKSIILEEDQLSESLGPLQLSHAIGIFSISTVTFFNGIFPNEWLALITMVVTWIFGPISYFVLKESAIIYYSIFAAVLLQTLGVGLFQVLT